MLGLGVKPNNSRTVFDNTGYVNETGSFWTHDLASSSTSLNSKDHICIIIHASWNPIYNMSINTPTLFHAIADQTNDTGFKIFCDVGLGLESNTAATGDFKPRWFLADGSGPPSSATITPTDGFDKSRYLNNWSVPKNAFQVSAPQHAHSSSPNFAMVYRFNGTQTNESTIALFSNSGITVEKTDVTSESTLGDISDRVNIQINNDDGHAYGAAFPTTNFTQPTVCIHKISIWNESITDAKIMTMMGFGGETFEETLRSSLNGFYAMHSRFRPYSDFGVSAPAHEWDFSSGTPKYYTDGTFEDTGGTGGLDMTPSGSPPIGSRGMGLEE